MSDRYVVLGLARSRQRWFSDLARWSTSAVAPIEYVKCLTADEARVVVGSGRRVSALVADGAARGVDRDLVDLVAAAGATTFVVADGSVRRDWEALGVAAVLPEDFGPEQLVEQLARHARPVDDSSRRDAASAALARPRATSTPLIGVTGPGGTGVSTVAMALAQAVADADPVGRTALADGARLADLSMYHDIGDVVPGLPELVEAHRSDRPDPEVVRSLLFRIDDRGYDLLLGQRRARDSAAMRPGSVAAAIDGLRRSYDLVVVDHDHDLEGEAETGSLDIEERHALSREVAAHADLVLLVGRPGMKGLRDLIRLVDLYAEAGVPGERLVPIVNGAPRHPAMRASATRALAELTRSGDDAAGRVPPPLFVRQYRGLEEVHRSAARLPDRLCSGLGRATHRLLDRVGPRAEPTSVPPVRLAVGQLGTSSSMAHQPGRSGHRGGTRRSDVA